MDTDDPLFSLGGGVPAVATTLPSSSSAGSAHTPSMAPRAAGAGSGSAATGAGGGMSTSAAGAQRTSFGGAVVGGGTLGGGPATVVATHTKAGGKGTGKGSGQRGRGATTTTTTTAGGSLFPKSEPGLQDKEKCVVAWCGEAWPPAVRTRCLALMCKA